MNQYDANFVLDNSFYCLIISGVFFLNHIIHLKTFQMRLVWEELRRLMVKCLQWLWYSLLIVRPNSFFCLFVFRNWDSYIGFTSTFQLHHHWVVTCRHLSLHYHHHALRLILTHHSCRPLHLQTRQETVSQATDLSHLQYWKHGQKYFRSLGNKCHRKFVLQLQMARDPNQWSDARWYEYSQMKWEGMKLILLAHSA